jgi:Domain of unknown function (DUF397)
MSSQDITGTAWRKASYSTGEGSCVEVGHLPGGIGVRDAKLPGISPVLRFAPEAWRAFVRDAPEIKD